MDKDDRIKELEQTVKDKDKIISGLEQRLQDIDEQIDYADIKRFKVY